MPPSVTMPPRDDLTARIDAAGITPDELPDGLYTAVLSMADREMTGARISTFLSGVARYCSGDSPWEPYSRDERAAVRAVHVVLLAGLPDLIRTVVDDAQVVADAVTVLSGTPVGPPVA
ncbi:hypothetical protein [Streptomyces sp. CAU 1734]|uniref:hypothetical protein n=1 Tax=Streptomyces sp. CAU 1734 TaxID=3140360 RepID=UPI0032619BED